MEVTAYPSIHEPAGTVRAIFNDALSLVNRRISESVSNAVGAVREMCGHVAGSCGKMIRPQLVLMSGTAFSRLNDRMIDAAVAAEFIHMASLVHDDVIDQSNLRRGKPSVNQKWGNHAAVLCGDWLFAQAFAILSGAGLGPCMRFMVKAIQSMCHGEMLQAASRYNADIGTDTYYDVIAGKTAHLMESCCKSGAAAGGADGKKIEALGQYGLNIGLAFQIIDDILDFAGDAERMGKPKCGDLRQGIFTLPVILLLRDAGFGNDARAALAGNDLSENAVETVRGLLQAGGAIDAAYSTAWSLIDRALNCLDFLPDSESKTALCNLARTLRNRTA